MLHDPPQVPLQPQCPAGGGGDGRTCVQTWRCTPNYPPATGSVLGHPTLFISACFWILRPSIEDPTMFCSSCATCVSHALKRSARAQGKWVPETTEDRRRDVIANGVRRAGKCGHTLGANSSYAASKPMKYMHGLKVEVHCANHQMDDTRSGVLPHQFMGPKPQLSIGHRCHIRYGQPMQSCNLLLNVQVLVFLSLGWHKYPWQWVTLCSDPWRRCGK